MKWFLKFQVLLFVMCHLTKYLREKGWKLNLSLQIDIEFPSDKTFTWVWVYKVISDDNIFFKGTIFILVWLLSIKVDWNFSLVTDNFWEFVFKLFGDITFLVQTNNKVNISLQWLLFILLFPKTQCFCPLRVFLKTRSRTFYCWWMTKTGLVRVVIRLLNDQLYFPVDTWTNRNAYQLFIWCPEYHMNVLRIFFRLALVSIVLWVFSDALRRSSCISTVIFCL